jgi:DNA-binding transcriptional LysR family regulator
VVLFDRTRRRAKITARGEQLLGLAGEMLSLRNRIADISAAVAPSTRTLRLGVTELTAMTWLPKLIHRIRGCHPRVTLEPVVDASVHLIEQLKARDLDIVIVPDAFRESRFQIVHLESVQYAWMCSPSYLDDAAHLTLQQLTKHSIIGQLHTSGLGDLMTRWLKENNVTIEGALSSSNLSAVAALTLSGLGISYLPRKIFDTQISSGRLKVIRSSPAIPRVAYVALYEKSNADEFLRFVAAMATETCDFGELGLFDSQ